ncbi:hypothetical protein AAFF_G00086610 [Aldrovandia affinis]|uniref:Reverse transcriptase/retrotransposon-derived protein RNase H-like domain-containing protein n=1 Tax=Aldrovandia affinis TaxID=143900 RepID=A0AAD7RWJ4_9TELE|nr:hypothetical protein AAFF_G00086610 [Aldrovandia affinis]
MGSQQNAFQNRGLCSKAIQITGPLSSPLFLRLHPCHFNEKGLNDQHFINRPSPNSAVDQGLHEKNADFLCIKGLLVDVKNAISRNFSRLLGKFPDLTRPTFSTIDTKHGVEHHINTTGPLVQTCGCCLDLAKLAVAKAEFANLERLGIVHRSNSPWASPLHMVPKPDGVSRHGYPLPDGSDYVVGAVHKQLVSGVWCPLAYFSRQLHLNEQKYSTFNRELSLYLAVRHFQFWLDNKPLTLAMSKIAELWSACQQRHLAYILEFTTDNQGLVAGSWVYRMATTSLQLADVSFDRAGEALSFLRARDNRTAPKDGSVFICGAGDKTSVVDIGGKPDHVSVDRLKPIHQDLGRPIGFAQPSLWGHAPGCQTCQDHRLGV